VTWWAGHSRVWLCVARLTVVPCTLRHRLWQRRLRTTRLCPLSAHAKRCVQLQRCTPSEQPALRKHDFSMPGRPKPPSCSAPLKRSLLHQSNVLSGQCNTCDRLLSQLRLSLLTISCPGLPSYLTRKPCALQDALTGNHGLEENSEDSSTEAGSARCDCACSFTRGRCFALAALSFLSQKQC